VRVFLDTNVLVSAFAARGLCSDLFELVLLDHELILSASVLRELSKALQQKVKLPRETRLQLSPSLLTKPPRSSQRQIPPPRT